jgi:hypothetical protein
MVYNKKITFNSKQIRVMISINKPKDEEGYHYNIELRTTERISGDEFQKLRKYLEDEGYVDEAESSQNF